MILWIVLIILALLLGLYCGYQFRRSHEPNTPVQFHHDYLSGLNYLLNDQPKKAVGIFINLLEVDKDTVETHISLGNLFRKKGEVDRALTMHNHLLDNVELNRQQHTQVLVSLADDYCAAGMFDRAEDYFVKAINQDNKQIKVLDALLDIYEKEASWLKAIDIAKKCEMASGKSFHQVIAQYYCALSETQTGEEAMRSLDEALQFDPHCVRASLLKGKQLLQADQYQQALNCLQKIKQQDKRYLSEAIDDIAHCYDKLNDKTGLEQYLLMLIKDYPQMPFVLMLSQRYREWHGDDKAEVFLHDYVANHPSFSGLKLLVDSHVSQVQGKAKDDLSILQGLIDKFLAKKPKYRCSHCGFEGRLLHWQCIGCKTWGSMLPVQGEEF